jgi:predicted nuclease with RNAse H fold
MIAGIDYGSKYAGTTAICVGDETGLVHKIIQSNKKENADDFVEREIRSAGINKIYMDAPLSIPGVYRDLEGFSDYFYRQCDRETGAMSPMFLGGLTARAIQLKSNLISLNIKFYEVWPSLMAEYLGISRSFYKSGREKISHCFKILEEKTDLSCKITPETWHQFDAILAFISGIRHSKGENKLFGIEEEGQIMF